jgi:hypothetical protein
MRRCRDHQDDIFARLQAPIAMDHAHAEQWPTALRRLDMACDLRLGHFRIMLEGQRGDRLAGLIAATDACERDDRADVAASACQPGDFAADIEVLALQTNAHYVSG